MYVWMYNVLAISLCNVMFTLEAVHNIFFFKTRLSFDMYQQNICMYLCNYDYTVGMLFVTLLAKCIMGFYFFAHIYIYLSNINGSPSNSLYGERVYVAVFTKYKLLCGFVLS